MDCLGPTQTKVPIPDANVTEDPQTLLKITCAMHTKQRFGGLQY